MHGTCVQGSATCAEPPDTESTASSGRQVGKEEFEIQARSCTLLTNTASPSDVLFRPGTCYRIPIFQRPYSWGEPEVRRLVNDLLAAYFGRNGRVRREPMFIGTIQLMTAVDPKVPGFSTRHDIIDGQQRITTMILVLRVLESMAPGSGVWTALDYRRRLMTTVSGTIQQAYLEEALEEADAAVPESSELNAYRRNLQLITELLREDEQFGDAPGDALGFADYLVSRVYFVIIETRAQLSKTLQIFDAINTSGMDLNGGDVFKIRYFEFLRERKGEPEEVFDKVCALYERIDQGNRDRKRVAVDMENVLSLAQQIVITDYGLSVETRNLAGTTFFERLFDVVLGIQGWEDFQKDKCEFVELPLAFIEELIDVCFEWEDTLPKLGPEAHAMAYFIWWSRYGRYHYLIRYFLHRFRSRAVVPEARLEELEQFIIGLSKLLLINSLRFQRITKDGRQKMREVMELMSRTNGSVEPESVINHLARERAVLADETRECLLGEPFAWIAKAKNIVCRLDAMLAELTAGTESGRLVELLFDERIDIEHIESFNHQDLTERAQMQAEWGDELNQLGNLIVLEYDLNRSISNDDYATVKRPRYLADSKFRTVQNFAGANEVWGRELASIRRRALTDRLGAYLCGAPDSGGLASVSPGTSESQTPAIQPA
ncbi:hypothetical protein HNR46_004088 [Haloferula luteola]|uniref:DUF262 domain-containing protein n=1 Tax=Haloferula luteola TaxID=595692 RepID=A0A840VE96_9BACT|nr:DUF262 domain-containing protein [Haloferula luteola]MBB5353824.1 hypothetical protein [Haloferula luteola]